MTRQDFLSKWEPRRDEWLSRGISAPLGPILAELLADLDAVARSEGTELLTLTQAAIRCGFSADSLGRMVRKGTLQNYGRKNAPRVRAADLPRKVLRAPSPFTHTQSASRQQARASTTPRGGK